MKPFEFAGRKTKTNLPGETRRDHTGRGGGGHSIAQDRLTGDQTGQSGTYHGQDLDSGNNFISESRKRSSKLNNQALGVSY